MAPAECVKVVIRCRPLNSKERGDGRAKIVEMDRKTGQIILNNPKGDSSEAPKTFTFDQVMPEDITQTEVYDLTARPIVDNVICGYNGTIFAYGQTGTGKTHTMDGVAGDPVLQGLIPNSFEHIFQEVEASQGMQWMVRASYLEIYNEEVRDLLSKKSDAPLELKEHKDSGVYVKGLNSFVVKGVAELRNVVDVSMRRLAKGGWACICRERHVPMHVCRVGAGISACMHHCDILFNLTMHMPCIQRNVPY